MTDAERHLAEAWDHYELSDTKAEVVDWWLALMTLNPNRREAA